MSKRTDGVTLRPHPPAQPVEMNGTLYVRIDSQILDQVGIDTSRPETIPDTFPMRFHKGGLQDGKVVLDLEAAAEAAREAEVNVGD